MRSFRLAVGVEKIQPMSSEISRGHCVLSLHQLTLRAVNDNNGACENLTPQKLCISQGMRCEANYESTSSYELTIDHCLSESSSGL